jgi:hypothetical protein
MDLIAICAAIEAGLTDWEILAGFDFLEVSDADYAEA